MFHDKAVPAKLRPGMLVSFASTGSLLPLYQVSFARARARAHTHTHTHTQTHTQTHTHTHTHTHTRMDSADALKRTQEFREMIRKHNLKL